MSNDSNYKLVFRHKKEEYLARVEAYLQAKKATWDRLPADNSQSGTDQQSMKSRLKEHGLRSRPELVSWGFDFEPIQQGEECFEANVTSWANENAWNVPISGSEGELRWLLDRFPELEVSGLYRDDYSSGTIDGYEKCPSDSIDEENEETILTLDVVERFLENEESDLIRCRETIEDAAAVALASYKGDELRLDGLTEISDASAAALAKYEGELYLGNLSELSDVAAAALAEHKGGRLSLGGLKELSDAGLEMLEVKPNIELTE